MGLLDEVSAFLAGFVRLVEEHKEFATLALATVGGSAAIWRWMVDQKWRRVQHAQSLIKEFLAKNSTRQAFDILDVIDEELPFPTDQSETKRILITDDFLIGALSTFDQKPHNNPDELTVRIALDAFFEDLNIFQSHIDAGLIKLKDIRPYLEYRMKELVGKGRCHKNEKFGKQVAEYLRYSVTKRSS